MQRNQPEQLMTWETQQEVVATLNYAAINENEIKSLWKLLKQIRKKIISKIWEFAGTFNKYKPSKIICTFLKWVLIGPHNLDRDRTTSGNGGWSCCSSRLSKYEIQQTNTVPSVKPKFLFLLKIGNSIKHFTWTILLSKTCKLSSSFKTWCKLFIKRKMEVSLYLALWMKITQSFWQSITWTWRLIHLMGKDYTAWDWHCSLSTQISETKGMWKSQISIEANIWQKSVKSFITPMI